MKLKSILIAAMAVSTTFVTPALASSEIFTVVNKTGYDINEIYISPTRNDTWEEDLLGLDILAKDDRTRIDFSKSEDSCLWDMKVIYTDGDESVWDGLNLCEISTVVLHYNNKTGETWADTD